MNREDPYRQKTDQTRRRIERASIKEDVASSKDLPPRGDLHRHKKKKSNWKLNYPILRLLALFFILLPVTFFGIYTYRDGELFKGAKKVVEEKGGYETVAISKAKEPTSKDDSENDIIIEDNAEEKSVEVTVAPSTSSDSIGTGDNKNSTSAPAAVPPENQNIANEKITYHTVQPGETLYRIAMKYYHTKSGINIIKKANDLSGNEITNGQVLKIPTQQ